MAAYNADSRRKVPEELTLAFAAEARDAASFMDESISAAQVLMTEYYRGDLPGITEQDLKDNRSDIVSRDVHDAVQAIMPDLMRVFLGGENVVEFRPVGKDDEAVAQQATEAIRHIFEKDNDAYSIIHGALKDGLIRRYAVATWWFEEEEIEYEREYSGLSLDQVADLAQEPGTVVLDLETPTDEAEEEEPEPGAAPPEPAPSGYLPDGTPDPAAGVHELKLRHKRTEKRFCVDLIPPEELLVSRKARKFNGKQFIGRRQNLTRAELIGMGFDEDDIDLASADGQLETHELEQARNPDTGSGSARADDGAKLVGYTEGYLYWADDDDDRPRLYKVCALGNNYNVVSAAPVQCVDMALWTPDPEPHTVIGESDAEKVADIQRVKTEIWRGVLDSLAEALVPRTEVVEGQVNMQDALSNEIGALVRVRQPGMVRPLSTPFVGQQAIPLLDVVDDMREERVGAFRAADGLSAEAMQSSTKMAVAATISGSKARKELLARGFAATFLAPIFRGLLRLFVENQDKPRWIRMRGEWTEVDPRGWNADMDCDVDVALAMATTEERVNIFQGVAQKQEMILQQLGPQNPICGLTEYSNTLRKLTSLVGIRNTDAYFKAVPPGWQPPQQGQPAPDPAMLVAQAQAQALQQEQQRKALELKLDTDLARDKQASEDARGWAELQAKYQMDMTLQAAKLAETQRANDMNFGLKQAQAQQAAETPAQQPPGPEGGPAQ
jgi:hypothetical protein